MTTARAAVLRARHAGPWREAIRHPFLDHLESEPVGVALLALWAPERADLDAWSSAAPGSGPYRVFVEHWATPEFGAYVAASEIAVDSAARPGEEPRAEALLLRVVRLERDFWSVAA